MEGPQTHLLAETLGAQLGGRRVVRIDVPAGRWQANVLLMNCVGQVVQRVWSHGRWVFLDFAHGTTWACCLVGRSGWRLGGTGKGRPLLTMALHAGPVATLTGRPVFLTLPTGRVGEHAELKALGPDPLREAFSLEELVTRLQKASGRTLAAALVDDEVLAGVGNHLKCEILFAARVYPGVRLGTLYASELDRIAGTAAALMQLAYERLVTGVTLEPAVYDRAGEGCRVCGTAIEAGRMGGDGHWSWYCPKCQGAPEARVGLFEAAG